MKKVFAKLIPCILCCILVIGAWGNAATTTVAAENGSSEAEVQTTVYSSSPVSSASKEALDAANALYELGLFNGTGIDANGNPTYELERTPNRHEAVTMLVRLLGKESTAMLSSWKAPFTDVADWAKPYVGYAYENGITLGTSNTTYGGSANTTATQYITFMLRTLGYSSETEFKWDAAWELSDKIGMTNGDYNASTKTFTRGDMVIISYAALSCDMRNGTTLYDYLVAEGAIKTEDDVEADTVHNNSEINTPYLTLFFDEALADHLIVVHKQGTPYTLEFYVALEDKPDQHLFDIVMGVGSDGNLGIIDTNLGEVPISLKMYSFVPNDSWTQDEINTVLAMQEAVNGLIDQLMAHQVKTDLDNPEISTGEPETDNTKIKTPFCTLHFPNEWKDYLHVEQFEDEDYRVMISAEFSGKRPVLLFTIIFGGDFGEQIGVVKNTQGEYVTVNVVIESLDSINYSETEMSILFEMQEAVNTLIAQMPIE